MIFKEPSRPFDPTAVSPLNLVVNEEQIVNDENDRLFTPSIGPFYMESVIVYDGTEVLVYGQDYACYVLHTRATKATRKPVACCIKVLKPGVTKVIMDYQVVGGEYEYVLDVIQEMLSDNADKVIYPIYWKNVLEKPETFNPASHMHAYWEFDDWDPWVTPIDRILQGILSRKKDKVLAVYEYLHSRIRAVEEKYNVKINDLFESLNVIRANIMEPEHTVIIRTDAVDVSTIRDGTWTPVEDKVLLAGGRSTVGQTVDMSAVIVYPQPDNTLLAEDDIPIVTDATEWIYLDNNHPVLPGEEEDYGKPYDTEFDLFYCKGWIKNARGSATSQSLSVDKTSVVEGGVVTFRVTTTGYPEGTKFPYQLSGLGVGNVDVPLVGYLTLQDGKATLPVRLIDGGPKTDLTTMSLKVLSLATLTKSVTYDLRSNALYTAKTYATSGYNTIKLNTLVVGDQFYLVLKTSGLKGKTLTVNLKSLKGAHLFTVIDGTEINGNYQVKVADNGEDLYLRIQSRQGDMIEPEGVSVLVKYDTETLDTFTLNAELLEFSAVWKSIQDPRVITEVSDNERFAIEVTHNSRQSLLYNLTVLNNPFQGDMLSAIPRVLSALPESYGRSDHIEFDRLNKGVAGTIVVRVSSTSTVVRNHDISINVPAVISE